MRFPTILRSFCTVPLLAACVGSPQAIPPEAEPSPHVPSASLELEPLGIEAVERIDVLFVVDTSGSMREEQDALMAQFPGMARALGTGDLEGDGVLEFSPPQEVRFGVISPELTIQSRGVPGCDGLGGDGLLRRPASASPECSADLPAFLSYHAGDDPERLASDFACLARLGTDGCGFEQPLEAALKALWPSVDERVVFHGAGAGETTLGHGDGANADFARWDGEVPSLLVIVLVTDEDDCSAADTRIFTPDVYLPEGDPLRDQDLNLRCALNRDALYPTARYAAALKLLRERAEQLVVLAAIAGVPPDLVDHAALAVFDPTDVDARERFYAGVLDDPRMVEEPDPMRTMEQGGNLRPSCVTATGRAYPPRRITEVVQSFGEEGVLQSICADDFDFAIEQILERVAHRMRHPG